MELKIDLQNITSERFFIDWIKNQLPNATFKNEGPLKKHKDNSHYHINSKNKDTKGTVEITLIPSKRPKSIILKLAENRKTVWSTECFKLLEKALHKI